MKYAYKQREFTDSIVNQLYQFDYLLSYKSRMTIIDEFHVDIELHNGNSYKLFWIYNRHKKKLIYSCEPDQLDGISNLIEMVSTEFFKYCSQSSLANTTL